MTLRTLLVSTLAAVPLLALAESDSPWLPIPGQAALGLNHTEQRGKDAYIGDMRLPLSAITAGAASTYRRATTTLRLDYGLSDSLAIDAAIGYAKVDVGAADRDRSVTDAIVGLRWRVLDEYESPALPTLTLRAAVIAKGNYDGARLASVGKAANGVELTVVLGRQVLPALAVWAQAGVQHRADTVPNAVFYEVGARVRLVPKWSVNFGYASKKFGGDLDIGGTGFSPARFQEVREERGVVKAGVGFAFAANQGLALNLSKATRGRNTVKDDRVIGLSYTAAF